MTQPDFEVDVDRLIADPATAGTFYIEAGCHPPPATGSLYVVTSTGRPGLRIFALERADCEYIAQLCNAAASQLVDSLPAAAVPTAELEA